MSENILDRIVRSLRKRLEEGKPEPDLEARAREAAALRSPGRRGSFKRALSGNVPAVIAECKHASPSAGVLRQNFDPLSLARAYTAGGAAAISVVVEEEYFLGNPRWIPEIRRVSELPVLRKDFIFTRRQLLETVLLGADAVLLIQRILEKSLMEDLVGFAGELGLDVLLEVFVDEDPAPAIATGAGILGVNARNLATFETRLDLVREMASRLPGNRVRVAESGIHTRDDLLSLSDAGYGAMLIGESLVIAPDPERALYDLLN